MSELIKKLEKALEYASETAKLKLEFERLERQRKENVMSTPDIRALAWNALIKMQREQEMDDCSVPAEFETFILAACEQLGIREELEESEDVGED